MCLCGLCVCTVIPHQDDVDTAVQFHLLKSVHQLTDDPVDHPQRVVQLETHKERSLCVSLCRINTFYTHPTVQTHAVMYSTHLWAQGPHFVSINVRLFRVHGVNIGPAR